MNLLQIKMKINFLFVLLFLLFANTSFACQRIEFDIPPCAQFTRADVVFLGKALKIENAPKSEDLPVNARNIRFQVLQNFKGADNANFSIITTGKNSAESLAIKKGETWLIYAKYDLVYKSFTEFRGVKVEQVETNAEVQTLKDILSGKTDTAISGQLATQNGKYLDEPVEISVESKGKKFTARTDADGAFNVAVTSNGTYKVELKFPFRAHLVWDENLLGTSLTEGIPSTFKYEVRLNDGDCHFSFFEVTKK